MAFTWMSKDTNHAATHLNRSNPTQWHWCPSRTMWPCNKRYSRTALGNVMEELGASKWPKMPQIEISLSYMGHAWKVTAGMRRSCDHAHTKILTALLRRLQCKRRRRLYHRLWKRNEYRWFKKLFFFLVWRKRKGHNPCVGQLKCYWTIAERGCLKFCSNPSNQDCSDNTF